MTNLPKNNFVFLETNRFDKNNSHSYLFFNPIKIISCYKLEEVKDSLLKVQDFISKGYYAAGFISYEAGFSFEETLKRSGVDPDFPLLWFGVYKRPAIFSHKEKIKLLQKQSKYEVKNLKSNISRRKYVDNIERIKGFIREGRTYQVNYTFKYKFDFSGSIFSLYEDLKSKQSVSYSALVNTNKISIVSLSPELFFRKRGSQVEVKPMKGTSERGMCIEEQKQNMEALSQSAKNRSENIMIVDLLRNDFGRISKPGSVKTEKLFEVEKYETLLQMISIVKCRLRENVSVYDLFKAIFPSGSVTGAPKISTMRIINSLEKEPRRIYTGSIGFFAPNGDAVFNVAIRTALINNKTKRGEMGIGSGIIIDSDAEREFEECELKADFMSKKTKDFKLIETILWRPEKGYFLLKSHLERLSLSAEYFNFKFDKKSIMKELRFLETDFEQKSDYKVRLILDDSGSIEIKFSKIYNSAKALRVGFSNKKTYSKDIFLYHKTTQRDLYNKEHRRWKDKGCFDVIFTNEKNQITEGAISNIIVKKGRYYYTPPVNCGLLNGVYRKFLFKKRDPVIIEKILRKKDLYNADKIYVINSVKGMLRVELD